LSFIASRFPKSVFRDACSPRSALRAIPHAGDTARRQLVASCALYIDALADPPTSTPEGDFEMPASELRKEFASRQAISAFERLDADIRRVPAHWLIRYLVLASLLAIAMSIATVARAGVFPESAFP
jgi:hypothetical protein